MDEQELDIINLGNLVENLNSVIADSEGEISLGNFVDKKPRKDPFLYRLDNRKIDFRGKCPLIQTIEGGSFLDSLFDLDSDIDLGYILVEAGGTGSSESYDGVYETIKLRIKHPLKLKNGSYIPNCSIKLLIEAEDWADLYKERKDHVRHYDLIWRKSDLSSILPTEWFLNKNL